MKISNKMPFVVGILFLALFLGLVAIAQSSPLWSVRREGGHEFGGEGGQRKPPEQTKISAFISDLEMNKDCVISTLSINNAQLELTFDQLSKETGQPVREMIEKIMGCRTESEEDESREPREGGDR